jgi:hypothetical protein
MTTLFSGTITTAGTVIGGTITNLHDKAVIGLGAIFTYGSGGTTAKAYAQTSYDDGGTWHDVAQFAFGTVTANKAATLGWPAPGTAHYTVTDGSLADNTLSGAPVGNMLRTKLISAGTYAGTTTLVISAAVKHL